MIRLVQVVDEPFLILYLMGYSMLADPALKVFRTLLEYLLRTLLHLLELLIALQELALGFLTEFRYCVVSILLNVLVKEVLLGGTDYIHHFRFLFRGLDRFCLVPDLVLQSLLILLLLHG